MTIRSNSVLGLTLYGFLLSGLRVGPYAVQEVRNQLLSSEEEVRKFPAAGPRKSGSERNTFANTLVLEQSQNELTMPNIPDIQAAEEFKKQNLILILGQSASAREYLWQAFSDAGYSVLQAQTLEEVNGIIAHHDVSPGLIVGCSESRSETEEIKAWHGQHSTIPLLLLPEQGCSGASVWVDRTTAPMDLKLEFDHPRETVMVVAEHGPERRLLAELLKAAGYEVTEASDGGEAARLLDENAPDILLTDVVLAGKNGLDLIQTVRRTHPKTTLVAMADGPKAYGYLSIARRMGAHRTLLKPFSAEQLLSALWAAVPNNAEWALKGAFPVIPVLLATRIRSAMR